MNSPAHMQDSVNRWLRDFEAALAAKPGSALSALFTPDAYWRDLMAFTGSVITFSQVDAIAQCLRDKADAVQAVHFETDYRFTPPAQLMRGGQTFTEAFFRFETRLAYGKGIVRLQVDGSDATASRAANLFTCVDQLKSHPETVDRLRPDGQAYSRDFTGPNWLDMRQLEAEYRERDPEVLVVGMGQAGLATAARLRQLGVDTLVIDRQQRVGDNWRKRYHALTLHNQAHVNHLPYMHFPPNWPRYIPKDKLANWFESYADAMEINHWLETELVKADYDRHNARWQVELRQAGQTTRRITARHIVMATSTSGIPHLPTIAGMENFAGQVLHSSQYGSAAAYKGKRVAVLGTGTSGHDIAQDLYSNGVDVTIVQRSPTLVVNIEPSAQLPYELYNEGRSLEECDLIAASMPLPLFEQSHKILAGRSLELDKDLLQKLEAAGFQVNHSYDKGWQFMYLERGGGYYFNVGCSELIAEKKIPVMAFSHIDAFHARGVMLRNGSTRQFDAMVLATGYKGQQYSVEKYFGAEVAQRVGAVWGFDMRRLELNNMWCETPQPGLWFIAGSFAQCRIYSKYLALQIRQGLSAAV
ncbi:MAG: monooxygenase [Limnohabitans sp.]|nr:monooxygenase [Limnohabitans sp.]